ncbi:kinase-like protein [Westerdykella ornata]|uniref:EKC/KEOPS complex subunit BUD32 n=1 Tax=Westerdykella ornata TaxID=318751 RepID=A0A6A6JS36_WESOR|nr:kinase-like protein [Westerdykella ornata]KAF2278678.1 kinase-like protein [Westerdykella ornata]
MPPEPTTDNPSTTSTSTSPSEQLLQEQQQEQQQQPQPQTHTHHTLPPPFTHTPTPLIPLTQGAEALVYRTTFLTPSTPAILKYRPPKPYRHPTLDRRLTKARLLAEARVLVRCRREGVAVPAVLGGDWEAGWLCLEFVAGETVRRVLDWWVEREGWRVKGKEGEGEGEEGEGEGEERDEAMLDLMRKIGRAVGKLHTTGVVHGDLTTSNIMLRPSSPSPPTSTSPNASPNVDEEEEDVSAYLAGTIVLIDFGLAAQSLRQTQEEDRAVDLYVLERAFAATHPTAERLFGEVLRAYGESYPGAKASLRRLEGVRLRGRKRSMLG